MIGTKKQTSNQARGREPEDCRTKSQEGFHDALSTAMHALPEMETPIMATQTKHKQAVTVCRSCTHSDECYEPGRTECPRFSKYAPETPAALAVFAIDGKRCPPLRIIKAPPYQNAPTFEAKARALCPPPRAGAVLSLTGYGEYRLTPAPHGYQTGFKVRLGRDVYRGFGRLTTDGAACHATVRLSFLYRAYPDEIEGGRA